MIRRPPRSTQSRSSAASDVYKRQVHNSQHRFTSNMSGFVTYLPRQCVEHPPTTRMHIDIAHSGWIGSTWRLPGALRKTSENNIFKLNKPEKSRTSGAMSFGVICQIDWREVGVAFELQCLRNCALSSSVLLLIRLLTLVIFTTFHLYKVSLQSASGHYRFPAWNDLPPHVTSALSLAIFISPSSRSCSLSLIQTSTPDSRSLLLSLHLCGPCNN